MKEEFKNVRNDLSALKTEGRNQNTLHIDEMSTYDMMKTMNGSFETGTEGEIYTATLSLPLFGADGK